MIVRCSATYPNEKQIQELGLEFDRNQRLDTTIGAEYVVLGVEFSLGSGTLARGCMIQYEDDSGHLVLDPLCLFEIVCGRASRFWEARYWDDGSVSLQPASFYRENYNEDLSERVDEVVKDFQHVGALLRMEAYGKLDAPHID